MAVGGVGDNGHLAGGKFGYDHVAVYAAVGCKRLAWGRTERYVVFGLLAPGAELRLAALYAGGYRAAKQGIGGCEGYAAEGYIV